MLVDMLLLVMLLFNGNDVMEAPDGGVDTNVVLFEFGVALALTLLLLLLVLLLLLSTLAGVDMADFDSCSIILRSAAFRSR